MRQALHDAAVSPETIDYINAHGSSTPLNDPTETAALRMVFGEHASVVPVSSTKGYYGHALGASGAFETAISALALHRGWIPPTLNLDEPDPACDLDYVTQTSRCFINGSQVGGVQGAPFVVNQFRIYAFQNTSAGMNANFDDYKVDAVPELPGALALGTSLLAMLARRRAA